MDAFYNTSYQIQIVNIHQYGIAFVFQDFGQGDVFLNFIPWAFHDHNAVKDNIPDKQSCIENLD